MNGAGKTINRGNQRDMPEPVTRRQTCAVCSQHKSVGQFPHMSDTCVRCKPMPAGWRRNPDLGAA